MESKFNWALLTDRIFRDEVSLEVGPCADKITIKFSAAHIEVTCTCANFQPREICTEEEICKMVHQSVEKGIKTITSAVNYVNAQYSFTFYCTAEDCTMCHQHPAKLMKDSGMLLSLKCDELNQICSLPLGYEKWQLGTTRLSKHHITILFDQLHEHSARWKEIGILLGFRQSELDIILQSLHYQGPKIWLFTILSEWLEWKPGDHRGSTQYASLEALKTAVSKAGLGVTADNLSITNISSAGASNNAKLN